MKNKNVYVGMGVGLIACGCAAIALKPKKQAQVKSVVGKAFRTMSEVADSISDTMGW